MKDKMHLLFLENVDKKALSRLLIIAAIITLLAAFDCSKAISSLL
jgi:hypothetical protein